MSWYDFVPVVGPLARLAQGEPGTALADWALPGGGALTNTIQQANNVKTKGFYDASKEASALGQSQKDFQMQGLNRAEDFYAPARARLNAAYGNPMAGPPPGAPPAAAPVATGPAVQAARGRGAF
jgi:hypothetical protein